MAITCPRCGAEFDATLFEFGRRVCCDCGMEIEYPGVSMQAGHVLAQGPEKAIAHEDRTIGCLLGTACGDILGAAVEGWSAGEITDEYGQLRDFVDSFRGRGRYTDDTQMTLALATSLVDRGHLDAAHAAATYAAFYESSRGYGTAAHWVMQELKQGADYRETGRLQFPEGSFANGGAMRIAPVGLAYRHATDDVLHGAVEGALLCTHVHPEAVDGAFIQAKAIAWAATSESEDRGDRMDLLRTLMAAARTPIMQGKLQALEYCLEEQADDAAVIARVGNGIRASEAVAAALWSFLRYGDTPEECVVRAVNFGGDADTVGAMAGALAGAHHGAAWIPSRWYDSVENGPHGRDEIVTLARKLARLDVRG